MKRLVFLVLLFGACRIERDADFEVAQQAALVSADLVIAEVYGGGGLGGAAFQNDYVVLFNRGSLSASLNGLRLSYASETGSFGTSTLDLPNVSVPAGGSYLIKLGSSGGAGAVLPTADASGTTINMSAGGGKIALTPISGGIGSTCGTAAKQCDPNQWVDFVGWGDPSQFEGTKAVGGTNTTSIVRANSGCSDSGDNGADFAEVIPATPRTSATTATPCAGFDLGPDLATTPDLAGTFALLNEVRWNPNGSDNGQEYIELIGTNTLPPNTWVLSVDGDATNAGKINYAKNVSSLAFGSNGLLLVKGATTTFAGVAAGTAIVNDVQLNGTPLQNGAESLLLVTAAAPLTITAGTTLYSSLSGITILDAISASDGVGTTYGGAAIPACPPSNANPVHAAFRIAGDVRPKTVAAWYAGQCVGTASELALDLVSICSAGPITASLSPGRLNNDPQSGPPDLSAPPDLKLPIDMAAKDMSVAGDLAGADLAVPPLDFSEVEDASFVFTFDLAKPPVNARRDGCEMGGRAPSLGALGPLLLVLALLIARSRRGRSYR